MRFYPVNIQRIIDETDNVRSFILEPDAAQSAKFYYQPGQFLTLHVPQVKGRELTQPAYLTDIPSTKKLKITVKREADNQTTEWLHSNLKVGDSIEISPPSGSFSFNKSDSALALIVDDSGIISMLSLLKNELSNNTRFVTLFYDCANYSSIIFRKEIDQLRETFPHRFECLYHLHLDSDESHADTLKNFVTTNSDSSFTICGLESHINFTKHVLADLDIDKRDIRIKNCSVLNQHTSPFDKYIATNKPVDKISHFKATLHGKDHRINYQANKTLLECMLDAGLEPYFSCSDAHCGCCMAIKKSGQMTMRKTNVLSHRDIERGYVLLCQAMPLSKDVWVDCDA